MTEIKQPKIRFKGFTDIWEQYKLGDLAEIVGGGTPSTKVSEYWNGNIDWYAPAELGSKRYLKKSEKTITELGLKKSSAKLLPIGTVLFTSRAGIGNTAILEKEGTTNQGFQSIVPKSDILDTYFIYSRTKELKKYGETKGAGTTFIEVSGKEMSKMNINVPNIEEQQKIGAFFKSLDDTIVLHQQKLEVTKQFKQTMLKKMFPKKDSNIPEIRFKGFTSEWKEQELKEFLSKPKLEELNLTSPDDLMTLKLNLGGLVSSKNKTTLSLTSTKYYKRKAGQFIFGKQNFFNGSMAIIPERFNNKGTSSFVPSLNIKNINSYFLYLNMSRKDFYKEKEVLAEGTGSKVLSENTLLSFKIKITENSNEQELIGNYFKELDNKIKDLEQKLETYKEFKKAMLQKMFI